MSLINYTKKFFKKDKELDLDKLPSMGLFYNNDFKAKIRKAKEEDIIFYEHGYEEDNISLIISKLKEVVKNNIKFSKGYTFNDLVSIDIIYIFIEIVKLTTNKKVGFNDLNKETLNIEFIEFSEKTFKYIELDKKLLKAYDKKNKVFDILGYKYSLPKIGVENSLSDFLVTKTLQGKGEYYSNMFLDFTYFSSHKKYLTFTEIENLVKVFNEDITEKEMEKINYILDIFKPFQKYSLVKNGEEIDIKGRIDLKNIWK